MATHRTVRKSLALALTVATAGLVTVGVPLAVQAQPAHIDPATLHRGPDPTITYLVRDTIRDGDRRVPATTLGVHDELWNTARGYVVKDRVSLPRGMSATRLVFISHTGEKRVIDRSPDFSSLTTAQAVSLDGRRIAWAVQPDEARLRTLLEVANPNTGRMVATRAFRLGSVVAVTTSRVLMTARAAGSGSRATFWWNYRRGTLSKLSGQTAVGADLRQDKVVFDLRTDGNFCNRVAPLSHPARTLWRSCAIYPHQWSPDGAHAVATHTYFDAAGTDRWWTVDGSTGARTGRVTGRLDWDAAWEDNHHFLTMAQSDSGKAAIIRCTVAGRCERASRLWNVPVPEDPSVFYAPPPVVLADN